MGDVLLINSIRYTTRYKVMPEVGDKFWLQERHPEKPPQGVITRVDYEFNCVVVTFVNGDMQEFDWWEIEDHYNDQLGYVLEKED